MINATSRYLACALVAFGCSSGRAQTATETVLHSFETAGLGGYPESGVIRDDAGYLYGTAGGGGTSNYGVLFRISPAGHRKVLYNFTGGADGGYPLGSLVLHKGDIYGTTYEGGTAGLGVVFRLDRNGTYKVL